MLRWQWAILRQKKAVCGPLFFNLAISKQFRNTISNLAWVMIVRSLADSVVSPYFTRAV